MEVDLFHDVQAQGPSGAAGFMPVPDSLRQYVEALVWSRFEASEAPCTTRLMPHGGLLLVVSTSRTDDSTGCPPVSHLGLRRLTNGQATLRTKPSGCLTLFALLTPAGAVGLMRHLRVGESEADRWSLCEMVGPLEARRLALAIERAESLDSRLSAVASWLEQFYRESARPVRVGQLEEALILLHQRPEVGLQDLVRTTGLGRRDLERKLRRWLGTSPLQQQRFARLQSSARLGWQRLRAVDIALEVGFADQAHFSRTINALTGMTAGNFLKRMDTPLARAFRMATEGGNLMPCSFESTTLAQAA